MSQESGTLHNLVQSYRAQLVEVLEELQLPALSELADRLHAARMEGHRIFIIGNGGSAATASHFATDFTKGAAVPGLPNIKAISLTDNVALMTAIGNDFDYESLFARQLEGLIQPDDILIAISASGNSPNILKAVETARQHGAWIVGLIGFGGGALQGQVDLDITVSSHNYGPVEDLHLIIDHMLTQYLKLRAGEQLQATAGN